MKMAPCAIPALGTAAEMLVAALEMLAIAGASANATAAEQSKAPKSASGSNDHKERRRAKPRRSHLQMIPTLPPRLSINYSLLVARCSSEGGFRVRAANVCDNICYSKAKPEVIMRGISIIIVLAVSGA